MLRVFRPVTGRGIVSLTPQRSRLVSHKTHQRQHRFFPGPERNLPHKSGQSESSALVITPNPLIRGRHRGAE